MSHSSFDQFHHIEVKRDYKRQWGGWAGFVGFIFQICCSSSEFTSWKREVETMDKIGKVGIFFNCIALTFAYVFVCALISWG